MAEGIYEAGRAYKASIDGLGHGHALRSVRNTCIRVEEKVPSLVSGEPGYDDPPS